MPSDKRRKQGFYVELPAATIKEIKRRAYVSRKKLWEVIVRAVNRSQGQ